MRGRQSPFPAEPFGFVGVPASVSCASATLPIAAQPTGRTGQREVGRQKRTPCVTLTPPVAAA